MTPSPPTADTPLTIVSASRLTAEAFPAESLLGRSLRLPAHRTCDTRIQTAKREPLGAIYNQALEQLHPESLVVFCHDDVWLGEACLRPILREALERFDLVGVAGSRRILPGQPTWWLQPDGRTWDHPHLLGEIRHGDPGASVPIRFGSSPAPAMLLDGVFLAARAGSPDAPQLG